MSRISTVFYDNLKRFNNLTDAFTWQREVFNPDGTWNNGPRENGLIISHYARMKANGIEIPVYAARATFSTHSFAYIEVETPGEFAIEVELELSQKRNRVVVLPENTRICAKIIGDTTVKATIDKCGSFSFVFDHYIESAVTVVVKRKEYLSIPNGYQVKELLSGMHAPEKTLFTNEKTVYVFKKGLHNFSTVFIPSNSVIYLEDGAILKAYDNGQKSLFTANRHSENITVCGRGAIDCSELRSGQAQVVNLSAVNNATVKDLTVINSCSWTICFTNCNNVKVNNLLLIGYRIWSDGVMLSDCTNSIVEDCFIKTGDDGAECKSTGDGSTKTDNILFRNIACWADKAACYGVIYEANYDSQNIRFENCSVGFSLPNWSKHLGCITVYAGNNPNAVDYNIYFKDIEIYFTYCASANFCAFEGNIKDVYVENLKTRYNFHETPILLWVKDAEKASIGKMYFDNIVIANKQLISTEQEDLLKIDIPQEANYNEKNVIINSKK